MNAASGIADWTRGGEGVVFQQCGRCGARWYFRREFCPECGGDEPATLASTGLGVVVATTLVHRAPGDAWRARVPYALLLVDVDDGFRMMAHGDPTLAIDDRVRCRFHDVEGNPLPYFERESS